MAEMNANDIYKTDIMTAMKWLCAMWDEIGSVAIQNFLQTTGTVSALEPSLDGEGKAMLSEPEVEQSMDEMVAMLVSPPGWISISMLLNRDNDFACTATPTDEVAIDAIIATAAGWERRKFAGHTKRNGGDWFCCGAFVVRCSC